MVLDRGAHHCRTLSPEVAEQIHLGMQEQLRRRRERTATGARALGWKIAINDPAVQRSLGLDRPVVGSLNGDRVVPTGSPYLIRENSRIAVEAEVAIHIGRDVSAGAAPAEARAAIDRLAAAFEVVDYNRPADGLRCLLEHSTFHEAVVFGDAPASPKVTTLSGVFPTVFLDGDEVRRPEPALVPADLGEIVALVAETIGAYGERLGAGDVILSGSFVKPLTVDGDATVEGDFGPLGRLRLPLQHAP